MKPKKFDIYKLQHGAVVHNTWREEGYNQCWNDREAWLSEIKNELVEILAKVSREGNNALASRGLFIKQAKEISKRLEE